MSESQRLSKQCAAILARLERGRVSNADLIDMRIFKYTGRISEVRKVVRQSRGLDVCVVEHDRESGLTWYALVPVAPPTQLNFLEVA